MKTAKSKAKSVRKNAVAVRVQRVMWRYEYKVTCPMLPSNATSPVMDYPQMTDWLNDMDAKGWEFVGYGQKNWHQSPVQEWWIFRRLKSPSL